MNAKRALVHSLCVISLVTICSGSVPVMAKNYYISQQTGRNGGDGTSLKNASSEVLLFCLHHNKLKPGDTVYVGPGNYQRNGYFTLGYLANKKTSGTKDKPIRFIADPKCKYLVNDKPGEVHLRGTAYQTVNLTSVNHIWLEGFRITSRYYNGGTGIMCRGSVGNKIKNCQFDHVGDGMLILDAEAEVTNCTFKTLSYRALFCSNNSTTIVEDCTFEDIAFRPISCFHTGTKMEVRRCSFKNIRQPLYFNPARGGILENCWISGSRSDGVQIKTANVAIRNCTFTNNRGSGIRLLASQYNIFNTVSVENCIFAHNRGIGLNHVPKYRGRKTKIRLSHSHNIFWQNQGGNYTSIVKKHKSEIEADPKLEFTNAGLRLGTNSPAIDKGKAISSIRDDMYLKPRPAGNGHDIGAVEAKGEVRPKVLYLIRRGGSDSNSGYTPQKAWKTMKHALRSLVAGDTLYVGGGTYNGRIYLEKSGLADHPITVIGDVSGAKTGHAGKVILRARSYGTNLRIHGGHFVFEGIEFRARGTNLNMVARTPCVFRKCSFSGARTAIHAQGSLTLDRCRIDGTYSAVRYTHSATIPNPTLNGVIITSCVLG